MTHAQKVTVARFERLKREPAKCVATVVEPPNPSASENEPSGINHSSLRYHSAVCERERNNTC